MRVDNSVTGWTSHRMGSGLVLQQCSQTETYYDYNCWETNSRRCTSGQGLRLLGRSHTVNSREIET